MSAMNPPVAFVAVKEEAAFIDSTRLRVLVTGMGGAQATARAGSLLTLWNPGHVFTCGFAGGLNPELRTGTVVYSTDADGSPYERRLQASGAVRSTFHCAARVAVTVREKRELRDATGADAVEMESSFIQRVCRDRGIRCDVVRVISDAADEDLPLNFNELMTADHRMRWGKLFLHLAAHPGAVPRLMKFQKRLKQAAQNMAAVLNGIVAEG